MERQKRLRRNIAIIIIVLFHVVGAIGLRLSATRALFLQIVPFHLLLMAIVVIAAHRRPAKNFLIFIASVMIVGFAAEWIGVHTGWLFGSYAYGPTLGVKLSGIPLIIAVNWFLLIYGTAVFMQRSKIKNPNARIVAGAMALTLLDVLIEPTAIKFNYWHWLEPEIPDSNYICWFLFSAGFLFLFEKLKFSRQSIVGEVFLIVQFLFFASLQV
jgi:putative membrane protein